MWTNGHFWCMHHNMIRIWHREIIYQTWTTIENVHLLSYYDNVIHCNFESSLSWAFLLIWVLVQSDTMPMNDTNIHIVSGHHRALCDGGWWLYSVYQYSWHPSYLQISGHEAWRSARPGPGQDITEEQLHGNLPPWHWWCFAVWLVRSRARRAEPHQSPNPIIIRIIWIK